MTGVDKGDLAVDRLLRSIPGNPICNACLAFTLDASLRGIQELTDSLLSSDAGYWKAALTRGSCGREVARIIFERLSGKLSAKSRPQRKAHGGDDYKKRLRQKFE